MALYGYTPSVPPDQVPATALPESHTGAPTEQPAVSDMNAGSTDAIPEGLSLPEDYAARVKREFLSGLADIPQGLSDVWNEPGIINKGLGALRATFGPSRMLASPVSAAAEEAGRGISYGEKAITPVSDLERLLGADPGIVGRGVEAFAPAIGQITTGMGAAKAGFNVLGAISDPIAAGVGKMLGPNINRAQRAAEAIGPAGGGITGRGTWQSLEGLLESKLGTPEARGLAEDIRNAQAAKLQYAGEMAGPIYGPGGDIRDVGLMERLSKMTPEELQDLHMKITPEDRPQMLNPQMTLFGGGTPPVAQPYAMTTQAAREAYPLVHRLFDAEGGIIPEESRRLGRVMRTKEDELIPWQARRSAEGEFSPRELTKAAQEAKIANAVESNEVLQQRTMFGTQKPYMSTGSHARQAEGLVDPELFLKNPAEYIMKRVYAESEVLGNIKTFGPEGEKLFGQEGRLRGIAGEWNQQIANAVNRAVRRDLGPHPDPDGFFKAARAFESVTKMSLSFIANASQSIIGAVVNGFRPTAKAFYELFTSPDKDRLMNQLGLYVNRAKGEVLQEVGGFGKISQKVLAPFDAVEYKLNQRLTANASEHVMDAFSEKLMKTGDLDAKDWRWLAKSGVDVGAVQQQLAESLPGTMGLSSQEILRGALGNVDRSQFLMRSSALPWVMQSSPLARFIFQMKSFSMRAGHAISREVLDEFNRGNYAPLARIMIAYPMAGEAIRHIGAFARGKSPDTPENEGYLAYLIENSLMTGGIGVASDLAAATGRGKESLFGAVLGPGMTDIGEAATRLTDIGQAGYNQLTGTPGAKEKRLTAERGFGRFVARKVPFVGPTLSELLKSPEEAAKTQPY